MIVGGTIGYRLLKWISSDGNNARMDGSFFKDKSKVEALLGPEVWDKLRDKVVLDFGCGAGSEAIEIARRGARKVIGLDLRPALLDEARRGAEAAGVGGICAFRTHCDEKVDVIITIDTFEHFHDPAGALEAMSGLLRPGGRVLVSFGSPWYHPLGGHLFSVFPWAHLLFTEKALLRWRSDFKTDRATRFHEVEGGLNQMTVGRFERLVEQSKLRFDRYQIVPIRAARALHSRWTREFLTSTIRCELTLRDGAGAA